MYSSAFFNEEKRFMSEWMPRVPGLLPRGVDPEDMTQAYRIENSR